MLRLHVSSQGLPMMASYPVCNGRTWNDSWQRKAVEVLRKVVGVLAEVCREVAV